MPALSTLAAQFQRVNAHTLCVSLVSSHTLCVPQTDCLIFGHVLCVVRVLHLLSAGGMHVSVPEAEMAGRADFRGLCVLSIDQEDCPDRDDCLHVTTIGPGRYQVGRFPYCPTPQFHCAPHVFWSSLCSRGSYLANRELRGWGFVALLCAHCGFQACVVCTHALLVLHPAGDVYASVLLVCDG